MLYLIYFTTSESTVLNRATGLPIWSEPSDQVTPSLLSRENRKPSWSYRNVSTSSDKKKHTKKEIFISLSYIFSMIRFTALHAVSLQYRMRSAVHDAWDQRNLTLK